MGIAKIAGKIIDDLAKIMGADIISLGDAAVGDVKSGKKFYAGSTTLKTGTMPTKAIVAGAETYEAGYHAGNPGGLSAIDTDLSEGNIKKDVNIFGKVGTYELALTVTEAIAPVFFISTASGWYTVASVNIPAGKKIVAWMGGRYFSGSLEFGDNAAMKIVYDGVEKAHIPKNTSPHCVHWGGDSGDGGLLELLCLAVQISPGHYRGAACGGAFYVGI